MRAYLLIVLFLFPAMSAFAQIEELHPCRDLSEFLCAYPLQNKVSNYLRAYSQLNTSDPLEKIVFSENELRHTYKITDQDLRDLFEEVKVILKEGISELKDVNEKEKLRLMGALTGTQFMTFGVFLKLTVPDGNKKKILEQIERFSWCGQDGLHRNAFQIEKTTVFCPGLIVEQLNQGATEKSEILLGLSQTMGHELGHVLDHPAQSGRYKATGECFNKYVDQPDFWKTFGNETYADYWGSIALGKMIRKKKPERDNLIRTLARHMSLSCKDKTGTKHPAGKLRIDLNLKTNPIIQEALGCRKKFIRSCSLQEY